VSAIDSGTFSASSSDVDIESDYCFPLSPNVLVPDEVKQEKKKDALVQIYPLTIRRPPVKRIPAEPSLDMLNHVMDRLHLSHSHLYTVALIAKYWALKRASQDNFPLIRRFQFEPWSPRRKVDQHVIDTVAYLVQDINRIIKMVQVKAEIARRQCHVAIALRDLVRVALDHPEYIPTVLKELRRQSSEDDHVFIKKE
jgi:hypothetical protein